jgi:SAM-dependent methyltransferase
VLDGTPVLVDFDHSVLSCEQVLRTSGSSYKPRGMNRLQRIKNYLLRSEGPTEANAHRFIGEVKRLAERPTILVIGGGAIGTGADPLYNDPQVTLIGTDIYKSNHTTILADGHQLPLVEGQIHGVWIQAVLEHVLSPEQVVAEIHRVLVPEGIVYAETPFMQQVHEGPYDFSRYTLSGHRWLFRRFEEIDSGTTRGPATVMLWSIRYFVDSFFGTRRFGIVVAMLFFWLRFFENIGRPEPVTDGASGVYFLGRRSDGSMTPKEVIAYYKGAQR